MAIDISSLQVDPSEKGVEVEIKHPATGAPLGITFNIVRRHSKAGRNIALQTCRENTKDKEESEESYAERLGELIVCDCVVGWHSDEDEASIPVDGEKLEFSQENVRKVLLDPQYYWILEQVHAAVSSFDVFFGKATKS